jgi:site-specific recombinase XerD
MRKSQSANKSPHVDSRGRDYLRPDEANALIEAAGKAGRQPFRDQCLLRLIYRHGLRARAFSGLVESEGSSETGLICDSRVSGWV